MKDLLEKITRSTVTITFKSGEKLENVIIEAVLGNTVVANHEGKLTLIEIPHIGYISIGTGIMEVMETILKSQNQNGEQKQENKDSKK